MKYRKLVPVTLMLILALAPSAFAEGGDEALKASVNANLEATAKKIVALAEATPEDMFGWRPNVEVRTVSEVYMHIVGANLLLPVSLGATPPEGLEMGDNPYATLQQLEKDITTKKEVIAKLEESFAYVTQALASLEDLDTEVQLFGAPQPKRAYYMVLLGHAHEHLGQAIAYTRSMGIVPPWSQPQN
ncbi:MAG: DinB family protein [Acidobacteriota bacterium]